MYTRDSKLTGERIVNNINFICISNKIKFSKYPSKWKRGFITFFIDNR